jgi:hypothetical protein
VLEAVQQRLDENPHALYAGPTLFVQLTNKILLRAAFSPEIAGHTVGEPGPLDLTNLSHAGSACLRHANLMSSRIENLIHLLSWVRLA